MELKELCWRLSAAKADEQAAKEVRLKAEDDLLAALGQQKMEGTTTTATDGYKITVTAKLTRKLDYDRYQQMGLPENLQFVKYKPEIDLKRLRAIEMVDPALVASCVTVAPAKPAIKLEEVAG